MKRLWPVLLLILLQASLLMGCGESSSTQDTSPGETRTGSPSSTRSGSEAATAATVSGPEVTGGSGTSTTGETREGTVRSDLRSVPQYGYTYGQASGNRNVDGAGDLPNSEPIDVQLDGVPVWVVGVPLEDDTAWVVTLEDGRAQAFRLDGTGGAREIPISPDRLAPGQPPLVKALDGSLELVTSDNPRASNLTHPVPVSARGSNGLIGVQANQGVFLERGNSVDKLGITALPDARPVQGANGTLAMLTSPTERYDHGVLGDAVEADSMTLFRPGPENLETGSINPASGNVFEQIAPLWFEVPEVDRNLLAVTESTPELATRVSVYSPDGSLLAAGPFIGEPYKWRHLISAGPFGPNGEIELVDTLTPHIGGNIEFYRPNFDNGSLDIVATQTGYTSHRIYTRNMDTARAGDLDGDGRWELLVPNDAYTELGAIRHEEAGATVAWTLPADGTIVTNLASATNFEGHAQIAAGRQDGVLRIWP